MSTIEAVRCLRCSALHGTGSETFIKLGGGVYVGMYGGLIGPHESYFCKQPCFLLAMEEVLTR